MVFENLVEQRKNTAQVLNTSQGVRLQSLVYIRWLAVLGQAFAIILVHALMGYEIQIIPATVLVLASALLNILVSVSARSTTRLSDRGAILYLFYDAVQLTGLLYLTGGLTNPFALLFLVPVTISATSLSLKGTMFLGATTIGAISLLAVFYQPLPLPDGEILLSPTYIFAIWSALVLGTVFLSIYAWRISSDSRRMTEALTAARFALAREQQLSVVGGIAAAAAHELGTPLNTILLVSEELSREFEKGSDNYEDTVLLYSQAKKCAEVLEQLSTKPDTNRFLQTDAHHNYLPIKSLIELISEKHESKGKIISIETDGDPDTQPRLFATPEIQYGIGNLISNAAEFAKSTVLISISWDEKQVKLNIEDDGKGFSDEILDRLGEPYTSSRAGQGGMGLGVFIAEMLIKHTGGHLSFRNKKNSGAQVSIKWPRNKLEKADPYR